MLQYTNRNKETSLALQKCTRINSYKVYGVFELHRDPYSTLTNGMTIKEIAGLSDVCRQEIYPALGELEVLGLIEVIKIKPRGKYQFRLLMIKSNVVKLSNKTEEATSVRKYTQEELAEAANRIPF